MAVDFTTTVLTVWGNGVVLWLLLMSSCSRSTTTTHALIIPIKSKHVPDHPLRTIRSGVVPSRTFASDMTTTTSLSMSLSFDDSSAEDFISSMELETMRLDLKEKDEALERAITGLERAIEEIEQLKSEQTDLKSVLSDAESKTKSVNMKRKQSQKDLQATLEELSGASNRVSDLENALTKSQKEVNALKDQLKDEVTKSQKEVTELRKEMEQAKIKSRNEVKSLREELDTSKKQLDTSFKRINSRATTVETSQNELHKLKDELEMSKRELDSSNRELDSYKKELDESTKEMDSQEKTIQSLQRDVQQLQKKIVENEKNEEIKLQQMAREQSLAIQKAEEAVKKQLLKQAKEEELRQKKIAREEALAAKKAEAEAKRMAAEARKEEQRLAKEAAMAKQKAEAEAKRIAAQKAAEAKREEQRRIMEAKEKQRQTLAAKKEEERRIMEARREEQRRQIEAKKAEAELKRRQAQEELERKRAAQRAEAEAKKKKQQAADTAPTVNNWQITPNGHLKGTVKGHPTIPDGNTIETSPLANPGAATKQGTVVATASGSKYKLGTPSLSTVNKQLAKKAPSTMTKAPSTPINRPETKASSTPIINLQTRKPSTPISRPSNEIEVEAEATKDVIKKEADSSSTKEDKIAAAYEKAVKDLGLTGSHIGQDNSVYLLAGKARWSTNSRSQVWTAYHADKDGLPVGEALAVKISDKHEMMKKEYNNYKKVTTNAFGARRGSFVVHREFLSAAGGTFDKQNKNCALVMERGELDLREYLAKEGNVGLKGKPLREAARSIAKCIEAVHSSYMVWTDLKSENFVVCGDDSSNGSICVKGIDLESAIAFNGNPVDYSPEACPPEFAEAFNRGEAADFILDFSYDIWSFGMVLYELATGHSYFDGKVTNPASIMDLLPTVDPNNDNDDEQRFAKIIEEDKKLSDLILKCLSTNPKQRPSIRQIMKHPYLLRSPFSLM